MKDKYHWIKLFSLDQEENGDPFLRVCDIKSMGRSRSNPDMIWGPDTGNLLRTRNIVFTLEPVEICCYQVISLL